MRELIINKPGLAGGRQVDFVQTQEQNDKVPCLRLYCTMHNTAYNLQIRGTVPLNGKHKSKTPRNLMATVSLDLGELLMIADYVAEIKKAWLASTDPDNYEIYPAEVIRQGLESNASEFNEKDRSDLVTILAMVERNSFASARRVIDTGSETVKFYTIKPDDK